MSENLALLGAYSDAMAAGDEKAVFEFWSPDFVSHVTRRVNRCGFCLIRVDATPAWAFSTGRSSPNARRK